MGFSALDLLNPFLSDKQLRKSLRRLMGFNPRNIELYKKALKHRSAAENTIDSNERLEYLGDAIFGAVVTDYLFNRFPYKEEGFLTQLRSRIVNRAYLNNLARKIGIDSLIKYQGGRFDRFSSLHGDAFEALIGAIYLDRGFKATKKFIVGRLFRYHIDIDEIEQTDLDFKSRLINWVQRERKSIRFVALEQGQGREKYYQVEVRIDGVIAGKGGGVSKKRAEQTASEEACTKLQVP